MRVPMEALAVASSKFAARPPLKHLPQQAQPSTMAAPASIDIVEREPPWQKLKRRRRANGAVANSTDGVLASSSVAATDGAVPSSSGATDGAVPSSSGATDGAVPSFSGGAAAASSSQSPLGGFGPTADDASAGSVPDGAAASSSAASVPMDGAAASSSAASVPMDGAVASASAGSVPTTTHGAAATSSAGGGGANSISKRGQDRQSKGFARRRGGQDAAYYTTWYKHKRVNWDWEPKKLRDSGSIRSVFIQRFNPLCRHSADFNPKIFTILQCSM
eukprot:symbB.v1.2.038719.t1/scaffold6041.1/size23661/1